MVKDDGSSAVYVDILVMFDRLKRSDDTLAFQAQIHGMHVADVGASRAEKTCTVLASKKC